MNNLVKGFTLLLFIGSITAYVAYRSGQWNAEQRALIVPDTVPKSNPGVKTLDTLPKLDSLRAGEFLLPGSKSMRLVSPEEVRSLLDSLGLDTVKIE